MKPAIAYGITGSEYSQSWEIMTITSEKTGRRGMVYGRDEHGVATHAKPGEVHGRFPTLADAERAKLAIEHLHLQHAPAIEAAEAEWQRLTNARQSAIGRALDNIKISPPVEGVPA